MADPYKAIIVEDEAPARRLLHELLAGHGDLIRVAGETGNGGEAISLINGTRPEVIFLDVQLPDMLGLDVLKKLDYCPYVIFTTAHDEYAVKAFDALSVDYLLKPLKEDRLTRALNKLRHFVGAGGSPPAWDQFGPPPGNLHAHKEAETLSVKMGGKFTLVQLSDIVYLEASDKYTFVHMASGQRLFCDHMLAVLEQRLSDNFIRVQKSYIVNRQKIVEINKYSNNRYTLVLNNRDFTRIITGPSYLPVIKETFEL